MKYNLHTIMRNAWKFFRKMGGSFAAALRLAWRNEKVIAAAKATMTEECHTWAGWKAAGREVIHGSKAVFQTVIDDPTTKTGKRTVSYFGSSQVA